MLYFALLPFSTNWQISQRDWNGGVQHRVVMYAVWLKLIDYAESLDRANVFTDHFCAPNIWALWRASENKSFFTVDCMIVDVCGRTARSSLSSWSSLFLIEATLAAVNSWMDDRPSHIGTPPCLQKVGLTTSLISNSVTGLGIVCCCTHSTDVQLSQHIWEASQIVYCTV